MRVDKPHYYKGKYEEFSEDKMKLRQPLFVEFFILPTFSYFGDYQILYDLKSQITYKAANDKKYKLLIGLSLSRDNLMNLMQEYPDARQYYFTVAFERRTEIRRRMKRFCHQLESQDILRRLLENN